LKTKRLILKHSSTGSSGLSGSLRATLIMVGSLLSFNAWAADLYVSASGSDANPGTQTAPLRTILKASQLAKPGTVVNVASGTYTGGFKTTASGTASARITYKSVTKWGAKIVPSSAKFIWDNRGNYTDIVGFDIDGSGSSTTTNGIYIGGSYNLVKNNHVHHLATTANCTNGGGSAIGTDHYYGGVNDDVISNVVHHIGSSTCAYIQGIYISTSGNVKNNLVYNIGAVAIHLWHDATSVNIVNNTATSSGTGIVVGGGDFYNSANRRADDCNVINNIVFDNKYGISEQGATGPNNKYLNNLVFQNSIKDWDLDSGKSHSGSIAQNPQFVSYNRVGTSVDFHLKSTSPALNRGIATLAPPADLGGMPRPQGPGFDIGAYELAQVAPVPKPILSLSAQSLVFASQRVGTTSAIRILTLKNTGNAPLSFPAGFVMSGDFAFGGTGTCAVGVSYAPGASCTASVVFKPKATGFRSGGLSILSNASTSAVQVSLSGTGY